MRKILVLLLAAGLLPAAGFRAGVGRIKITPEKPIWLSGYASRNHPSEGVLHDLWAKALAIEDGKGQRVVIVTMDLIGLPRSLSDTVAARVAKEYGLERSRLLLNCSHTHTGPVLRENLKSMYNLDREQAEAVDQFSAVLENKLVGVVGAALGDLAPARLSTGHGKAVIGINRRQVTPKGVIIGLNPDGPTDPDVPVLKIESADGKLRAILFGFSCHNTTLTGEHYKLSGDYAGFAQIDIEKAHPGATAMFMQLCGADQNPNPRGKIEHAEQHGQTMAWAVGGVLAGAMKPVRGNIRTAFLTTDLAFKPHTREQFVEELNNKDKYRVRRAQAMLRGYDEGHPLRRISYPVQAIRLGKDFTVLALGGEVVVEYALRGKKEFPGENLVVAGYSNEVACYIPSLAVMKGGGYEPEFSQIYYGYPGPFTDDIEETVFTAIHKVMARVGAK
jgi:neutral ceramidase